MEKIIRFLTKLLGESQELIELCEEYRRDSTRDRVENTYTQKLIRWLNNIHHVLIYAELDDFLKMISNLINQHPSTFYCSEISFISGVLESAKECLLEGFVGKLKYLIHGEMFDSLLEQADSLLNAGQKISPAVLGRIVIERWLRDQAEKAGISSWETDKASTLNDGLKKVGVLSTPKWRQIQSHLDIGNSAAHGKDSEFSETDVRLLIGFAKANCS